MNKRTKLVFVLMLDIITALTLCITAQCLTILQGKLAAFSLSRLGLNFLVAYPVAVCVGMLVPTEKFGAWVCTLLRLKKGPVYGIVMNICINLVNTAVLSSVMTYFNVVILNGLSSVVFLASLVENFLPMLAASCVVSAIAKPPISKWAVRITGNGEM